MAPGEAPAPPARCTSAPVPCLLREVKAEVALSPGSSPTQWPGFQTRLPGHGGGNSAWLHSWTCNGAIPSAGRVATNPTASAGLRFKRLQHQIEIPAVTNAFSPCTKRSGCKGVISAALGESCCPTAAADFCTVTCASALGCTAETPRRAFTNREAGLVRGQHRTIAPVLQLAGLKMLCREMSVIHN